MKIVVFYHIPRTAGSTFWHSLVENLKNENIDVIDTYQLSINKYGSPIHEQEFLDKLLEQDLLRDSVLHVHGNLDFSKLPSESLLVYGKRNWFSWRTSYINHNLKLFFKNIKKKKITIKYISNILINLKKFIWSTTEIYKSWIDFVSNKNITIINYELTNGSIIESIEIILKFLEIEEKKIKVIKYKNNSNSLLMRHDSNYLINFFGILINIFTLLTTLIFKNTKRSDFILHIENERKIFDISLFSNEYNKLFKKNMLLNSDFEVLNYSDFIKFVNDNNSEVAKLWFLDRGGDVIFSQRSRLNGLTEKNELDSYVEIKNLNPNNNFIMFYQKVNLKYYECNFLYKPLCFSISIKINSTNKDTTQYYLVFMTEIDSEIYQNSHRIFLKKKKIYFDENFLFDQWNELKISIDLNCNYEKLIVGILLEDDFGLMLNSSIFLKKPSLLLTNEI